MTRSRIVMKYPSRTLLLALAAAVLFCAAPRPHRFTHTYSVPQALRFVRQMLIDRGYRIAIFDTSSGIIKTERKDHLAEDGSAVRHQISVTVVTTGELLIKVLPASARRSAAAIMAPIAGSLQAMGFTIKNGGASPPGVEPPPS